MTLKKKNGRTHARPFCVGRCGAGRAGNA
ncbi:zinc-finger domain-containing protein [Bradyrhizobium sp. U87765 SZCCT0109]